MEPKNNNQLAVVTPGAQYKTLSLNDAKELAGAMVNARMFPDLTSANTAYIKIIAGQEMGIPPFQAMSGIHIISGRATLAANLMAAKVMESGRYRYRVQSLTDEICIIEFQEKEAGKWVPIGASSFSREDATKAGTKNMEKFGRNMLFARAMSNGVKWYTPDVFGGSPVYVEGEVVEGETIEGEGGETADEVKARREAEAASRREHAAKAGSRRTAAKVDAQTPNDTPAEPEAAQTAPNEPTKEPVDPAPAEVVVETPPEVETVKTDENAPEPMHSVDQRRKAMAILGEMGFNDAEKKQVYTGLTLKDSFKDLTVSEAAKLIEDLEQANNPEGIGGLRFMFINGEDNAATT